MKNLVVSTPWGPLGSAKLVIGRALIAASQVDLPAPLNMSGKHLDVRLESNRVLFKDHPSTNGTYVVEFVDDESQAYMGTENSMTGLSADIQPGNPNQVEGILFLDSQQQEGVSVNLTRVADERELIPDMILILSGPSEKSDAKPFPTHVSVGLRKDKETDSEVRCTLVVQGCKIMTGGSFMSSSGN